jgi:DNA-directed RNA polymerase
LYNAGSRIYATPEQAKSLAALKDLLVVSEDFTSTVDETHTLKDEKTVKQLLNELEAEAGQSSSKKKARDEDEEYDEVEEDEDDAIYQRNAAKEKKSQQMDAVVKLMGKFVNMTDLLPPLPEKGEFNVETIKQSQYFFS